MRRFLSMRTAVAALALVAVALASFTWVRAAASPPAPLAIAVTPAVPIFTPRVTLVEPGRRVLFTNTMSQDVQIQTTPHNPAQFHLTVPAGGSATLTLTTPGLYHFYDAATAHVIDYQADNDVVHDLPGAPTPHLPIQGWIVVPGPSGVPFDQRIDVPALHDLMAPHATVVRVGGSVVIHNHDTDAHNMVTDPGDPAGAAFELLGTDGEPSIGGAERRITFTKPGLYHIYCSIHTKVIGQVGQWKVVVPRDSNASGYMDNDPMETWVLVVP